MTTKETPIEIMERLTREFNAMGPLQQALWIKGIATRAPDAKDAQGEPVPSDVISAIQAYGDARANGERDISTALNGAAALEKVIRLLRRASPLPRASDAPAQRRLDANSLGILQDALAMYARHHGMHATQHRSIRDALDTLELCSDAPATAACAGAVEDARVVVPRDFLGSIVREAWVKWARTQTNPKASWLLPYEELSESDKEADRQIGEAVVAWVTRMKGVEFEPAATAPAALTDQYADLRRLLAKAVHCIENLPDGRTDHARRSAFVSEIKRALATNPSNSADAATSGASNA